MSYHHREKVVIVFYVTIETITVIITNTTNRLVYIHYILIILYCSNPTTPSLCIRHQIITMIINADEWVCNIHFSYLLGILKYSKFSEVSGDSN